MNHLADLMRQGLCIIDLLGVSDAQPARNFELGL